jgi:uncharacterized protein with NRDE domain
MSRPGEAILTRLLARTGARESDRPPPPSCAVFDGCVCLGLLRFDPDAEWPVLLTSIRDEFLARPAAPPDAWWPEDHPGLIGGKDVHAGGTWLAVDPLLRRVAAVYTPGKPTAADSGLRSRGELPLLALRAAGAAGPTPAQPIDPSRYEPFSLLVADAGGVSWSVWKDGEWSVTAIEPGMHTLNNWGLDVVDASARQARWRPLFGDAVPGTVALEGEPQDVWRSWIELLAREPEPEKDDSLFLLRKVNDEGYGTKSASLIAIGPDALRYDATETPWEAASWRRVPLPAGSAA